MGNINSQQVIIALILVCGLMLLWSIWKEQIITIIIKSMVGMGIIWIINLVLPTIAIGINLTTVAVVGVLGIPGIIMLYMLQSLL